MAWGLRMLGRTIDDAAGEAFDKVRQAAGTGLPWRSLPWPRWLKRRGTPFALPRPLQHNGDFDFSFAGLKTAVRVQLGKLGSDPSACAARRPGGQHAGRDRGYCLRKSLAALKHPAQAAGRGRRRRCQPAPGETTGRETAKRGIRVHSRAAPLHRQRRHDRLGGAMQHRPGCPCPAMTMRLTCVPAGTCRCRRVPAPGATDGRAPRCIQRQFSCYWWASGCQLAPFFGKSRGRRA